MNQNSHIKSRNLNENFNSFNGIFLIKNNFNEVNF